MKRYLLNLLLIFPVLLSAQSLSYFDLGLQFSQDDMYGTARYTGMSGAFGALGGDMSAVDINPAGIGVFLRSDFEGTMQYRNTKNKASFYGPVNESRDDYFKFSQAGGVMVFNTHGSGITRFSMGFNYSVVKDFNNSFFVRGNSGIPDFIDDPYLNYDDNPNNNVYYINVDEQRFRNYTSGVHDRFAFTLGGAYGDKLYFGAGFNTHYIGFSQRAEFEEYNNDGNDNLLDAFVTHYLSVYGTGFDFSLGVIYKPVNEFRVGLSYHSPVWFNLSESFIEDLEISVSNNPILYTEYGTPNYFDYSLNTPGKFTGSMAYVFGKSGLISFDYEYMMYNNLYLQPSADFTQENSDFSTYLRNTSNFRVGGEYRMNILSLRAGYRFNQTPFRTSDVGDLTGYSFGLGIHFNRFFRIDLAYDNFKRDSNYGFLNIDGVDPAYIQEDNNRFTSTLVFSF